MKKAVVLSVGCPKCGALPHKQCKDSDRCCPAHQERWETLWGSRQRTVIISHSSYEELIAALKPDDRYLGDNGELVLISRSGNCLHVLFTDEPEKLLIAEKSVPTMEPTSNALSIGTLDRLGGAK